MGFWGDVAGGLIGAAGSILGGRSEAKAQKEAAAMNAASQKEFAQMGIRWKVADAKAAGIHPLVGLGASTTSFTPVHVGDSSRGDMYRELGRFGQDVSRAASATSTQTERDLAALQLQSARLDVEGKALDNQYRARKLQELQTGPSFPSSSGSFIPGQGNSGSGVIDKPQERVSSAKGAPHSEPGAVSDVGWVRTHDGGVIAVPSKDAKERIEDNVFHETTHFIRNNVLPNFGVGAKPPKSGLPKGATDWRFDKITQSWRPYYQRKIQEAGQRGEDVCMQEYTLTPHDSFF